MSTDSDAQAGINEETRKSPSAENALSPIFRLPPEILAAIFVHCARFHHKSLSICTRRPGWVKVSYVCRHWREVALGCPTLWSYHFVVSSRWTEELLARSMEVPLKIRFVHIDRESDSTWWLDPVKKLVDHAEHIQECILCIPSWCIKDLFSQLSSRRAPRL